MLVDGVPYRTIWLADDNWTIEIIDQTKLPHEFKIVQLKTLQDTAIARHTFEIANKLNLGTKVD